MQRCLTNSRSNSVFQSLRIPQTQSRDKQNDDDRNDVDDADAEPWPPKRPHWQRAFF